jgi:hypothetical protein
MGKRDEESVDLFTFLRQQHNEKQARQKLAAFERMSRVEKAEYRGATVGMSAFYRSLGPRIRFFHDGGFMDRIHSKLLHVIQRGKGDADVAAVLRGDAPRPLCLPGFERHVQGLVLHPRKRLSRIWHGGYSFGCDAAAGSLWLYGEMPEPRQYFDASGRMGRVQVILGLGLVSDYVYSKAMGEYVAVEPSYCGLHWECASALMSLDEPAVMDLRVNLPFSGGVPKGVAAVGTVGVLFFDAQWDTPYYGEAGMEIVYVGGKC